MTSPASRFWTTKSIAWIGGGLIAAIVGAAAYDIESAYRDTVRTTERELSAHARVIAEQTARSFQALDVQLRHLEQLVERGMLEPRAELRAYLRQQAVGLVQVEGLLLIGADGRVRATSYLDAAQEAALDVSGTDLFQALRAHRDLGLFIGNARRSQVDEGRMFPVARRVETPDGVFAGVIAARSRIDYFQQFYRDIRLDDGTAIALLNRDRTLLARHPAADAALGRRLALSEVGTAAIASGQPALVRAASPVDGVDRFVAQHPIPDYGLAVFVTREAAVALAPWRAQSIAAAARTLALSALAALLLWLFARQLTRLQQTQDSLVASQERFALAVAGSNDGIIDWNVTKDRMYVSERAMDILGIRSRDSLRTRAEWMSELRLHPDDVAQMQDSLRWVFEGEGDIRERELRVQSPGGDYRWVRIRGKLMREASGRPLRWAGSVTDVDARRRAEERLRESEERFQLAVAGSNDGIVDWDLVNDRMYASERALEILGIDSRVTVRTRAQWRDLIQYHPDDQARMSRDLQDFLDGRTSMRDGEYRVLQPDGSYRWIQHRNKCVRDAAGRPLRVAGSISDIDARKRAEERFQLAVEGSNEGLWDWDMRTDLNYISPRLQEIMGLEPGEPLRPRKEWLALTRVHPDDLARVKEAQRAHRYAESSHLAIEYRIGLPSGEWRWVRQRGVALRDGQGRPYRIAGSTEDITAFKNAEAERARLEDQLLQAKKLEAIGTLAGGIAHDFNNILAAILGYGEMAQKAASAGTPLRRHVDAVVAAGLRAKSLVERILAFSRSGVGARVAVGVQSVVTEALGLVSASLPAEVRLERVLQAPDAAVMGDPTQIHQVVMNLCANAAQAMKSGGTLTVTLDVVDKVEALAATSTLAAGRYVRLAVADTGTGIPDDVRDRIFDPFFTTKGVGVGTGLGLSLVHGIVTDLGGGIDVESGAGEGTTFTVYLPWSAARVEASATDEALPTGAGQTILLVDDEEPLVRLGEELIAGLGYEPVGFTSSAAALAEFRAAPDRFQAVLSDETMPELTGSALVQEIRRLRPDLPIVLMTGFVSPALSVRARGLGVAEVLAKPLVERDIARALATALNGRPRGQA